MLPQTAPTREERELIANVERRVELWNSIGPYYTGPGIGGKTAQSRGTEAVLDALVLADHAAQLGQLSDQTRAAFAHLWALQQTTGQSQGSWLWLQFDQEPWEAKQSAYYGACLAALAVGVAPDNYASTPKIQAHLKMLREYLRRNDQSESLINQLFLLWASTKLPGLLNKNERAAIVSAAFAKQQRDGGWRLASITWNWHSLTAKSFINMWLREKGTPLFGASDGAATGLVTYVLQEAGVPPTNGQLQRGLSWLVHHQAPGGDWPTHSVNRQTFMSPQTALFMTDAGTAFAVLALTYQPTHAGLGELRQGDQSGPNP